MASAALGGGSFRLDRVGQCVTAPWYGLKFRPAHVPQGEGTATITLPDLGALVGFPRDYPWTYIPSRAGAKGTRNIAQMIADAVSLFVGAAISAAVQGEDWYEPTAAHQATLYRLPVPKPGTHCTTPLLDLFRPVRGTRKHARADIAAKTDEAVRAHRQPQRLLIAARNHNQTQ